MAGAVAIVPVSRATHGAYRGKWENVRKAVDAFVCCWCAVHDSRLVMPRLLIGYPLRQVVHVDFELGRVRKPGCGAKWGQGGARKDTANR